jgi:hypothetical protein
MTGGFFFFFFFGILKNEMSRDKGVFVENESEKERVLEGY